VISSATTVRRLSWALVILAIASALLLLPFVLGYLRPFNEADDLVERLVLNRGSDTQAFPFVVLGSLASIGVFLVGALLGAALRPWAAGSSLRDAMSLLLVIGGTLGIAANLVNIAIGNAATFGYCDCGYRTEEVIAQNYALQIGWEAVNWLTIGAVTLVGFGVAVAGRIVPLGSTWQTLSYVIAGLLLVAVLLRLVAAFVFIEAFDPFQIADLITAVALGILVPIWAVLLARGITDPEPQPA